MGLRLPRAAPRKATRPTLLSGLMPSSGSSESPPVERGLQGRWGPDHEDELGPWVWEPRLHCEQKPRTRPADVDAGTELVTCGDGAVLGHTPLSTGPRESSWRKRRRPQAPRERTGAGATARARGASLPAAGGPRGWGTAKVSLPRVLGPCRGRPLPTACHRRSGEAAPGPVARPRLLRRAHASGRPDLLAQATPVAVVDVSAATTRLSCWFPRRARAEPNGDQVSPDPSEGPGRRAGPTLAPSLVSQWGRQTLRANAPCPHLQPRHRDTCRRPAAPVHGCGPEGQPPPLLQKHGAPENEKAPSGPGAPARSAATGSHMGMSPRPA